MVDFSINWTKSATLSEQQQSENLFFLHFRVTFNAFEYDLRLRIKETIYLVEIYKFEIDNIFTNKTTELVNP